MQNKLQQCEDALIRISAAMSLAQRSSLAAEFSLVVNELSLPSPLVARLTSRSPKSGIYTPAAGEPTVNDAPVLVASFVESGTDVNEHGVAQYAETGEYSFITVHKASALAGGIADSSMTHYLDTTPADGQWLERKFGRGVRLAFVWRRRLVHGVPPELTTRVEVDGLVGHAKAAAKATSSSF